MDAYALTRAIFDNDWTQWILGLIGAKVLTGVAVAIFSKKARFYLGNLGEFLFNRVLPYLLCWGAAKLIVFVALSRQAQMASLLNTTVSGLEVAALVGKIISNLRLV